VSVPKRDQSGQIIKAQAPQSARERPMQDGMVTEQRKGKSLREMLMEGGLQTEIARALPKMVRADRMIRIFMTALRTTPDLARCDSHSFLGCILQAAQLGLECNTHLGHAYLIPRYSKKQNYHYCTLIIGYQGMLDLSYRSGYVGYVESLCVRKGDVFEREKGLHPVLRHIPSELPEREMWGDDGDLCPITHVWAKAELKTGGVPFVVLSRAQVDARRRRSAASGDGPWVTDYEAMVQKTGVRALWKFVPKSSEMATSEALDVALETGAAQHTVLDPDVQDVLHKTGNVPLSNETDGPDEGSSETDQPPTKD